MSHKVSHRIASVLLALALTFASFGTALAAPPGNDDFNTPTVISALDFHDVVDITEATADPNEPQGCNYSTQTVWYSYTATADSIVKADLLGSSFLNTNLSVYQVIGPDYAGLSYITCAFDGGSATFNVQTGMTYYFQAGSIYGDGSVLHLNLQLIPPPPNDNFGSAKEIQTLPFNDSVDMSAATAELDEPQSCGFGSTQRTAWYSFTPSANAMISTSLSGNTSFSLTVYQAMGPGFGGLSYISCIWYNSDIIFAAQAGTTYYIQVNAFSNGELNLNLHEIPPPPNDNFDNATDISVLPFSDSVDNTGATGEVGEPQSCGYTSQPRTVWYKFTPSTNALVSVDMFGSSFEDTSFTVYRVTGDGFAGLSYIACTFFGGSINFDAQVGTTYYIQARSSYSGGGNLHLNVHEIPPPTNDNFADATIIPSPLPFSDTVDASAATVENGEPLSACAITNRTTWYSFTATATGSLTANTYAAFAVYTGNSFATLAEIGCHSNYSFPLTFHATAGTTYYFQVGNYNGFSSFQLEVTPPPQANFYYSPVDASKYDTIQFQDSSYDPGNIGFQTSTWDFGDGTSANTFYPSHKYAADGSYAVSHRVTTVDGRTGSITQTVQVRTHDVAVTKVTAPMSANVGQTRTITVNVRNTNYPETVTIDLYKSTPSGFTWVASLTNKTVPVLSGSRTTSFSFNYTFVSDDAKMGKVTFQAIVSMVNIRDALPSDNQLISSPPTKVLK